jgi:hypothetical protein
MLLRCSKTALLVLALASACSSNASAQTQLHKTVLVPERVAILVTPILDRLQHYQQHRYDGDDRSQVDERFYSLTQQEGPAVDEALVVLMCFEVMGESQEETDEVIARGRRMLPYIQKYRDAKPKFPARSYSDLLKGLAAKDDAFEGATKAIKHGWRGTWDNPEGQ